MDEDDKIPPPSVPTVRDYQKQAIRVWLASTLHVSTAESSLIKPDLLKRFEDQLNLLPTEERNAAVLEVQKMAVQRILDAAVGFEAHVDLRGGGIEVDGHCTGAAEVDTAHISVPSAPPRACEALVGLFCKRDMREAVLGDLDEKFAELVERRGARVAKAWYWGQAGRSVLFFAVRWGRRLLELEAILKRIL